MGTRAYPHTVGPCMPHTWVPNSSEKLVHVVWPGTSWYPVTICHHGRNCICLVVERLCTGRERLTSCSPFREAGNNSASRRREPPHLLVGQSDQRRGSPTCWHPKHTNTAKRDTCQVARPHQKDGLPLRGTL